MPLNIRIQRNAGTACVSECVLETLACRGLCVGVSALLKGLLEATVEAPFSGAPSPKPWAFLAKYSAEKTKYTDISQPLNHPKDPVILKILRS